MRLDDVRQSGNIEDRRGQGGYSGGGSSGGRGGLGVGMVMVLGLVGYLLGIDPRILIGGAEMVQGMRGGGQSASAPEGRAGASAVNDETGKFVSQILATTEDVFGKLLPQQGNVKYRAPKLVLFSGATRSGCGAAQSAMGPFYCPLDEKVYLDTSFFREMQQRLGGGGKFAYGYVVAHEVGHHVENVLGILPKVQEMQQRVGRREANALSVRVELMADCIAGVWGNVSKEMLNLTEPDVREAIATAAAIGDDRLQKQSQGYAVPDSFTHGTSEQRVKWFMQGFKTADIRQCNTFNQREL